MSSRALAVVEFLLTAHLYNADQKLDGDDLPPQFRTVFWTDTGIERPLSATEETTRAATSVDDPWDAVSGLMFTDRDTFTGDISLAQPEMAEEWFLDRVDDDRLLANPTLAAAFEGRDGVGVTHAEAREANRPMRTDRAWINSLLAEHFDEDEDEDGENMLDLVDIRAPEEIEMTLDDLVLTSDQEAEIGKMMKAIEYREYLADIGLREIGKLLFVGPPGTGKTTTARALAHDLDLPFVEVKLSMITSQYLGETAKNVEKVFEVAKRLSPCILFMDEFDFVAKTRRSDEHAAIKRAVNTLLKSIDNISLIQDDVLLIGATNHPDQLDAAAWRRFDEIMNFPKPDSPMRADIFRLITRRMDVEEFDPAALAEERRTLTQADLVDAIADFEERDNLKNLDMIEGDPDTLIAGADISGVGDSSQDHSHDHSH